MEYSHEAGVMSGAAAGEGEQRHERHVDHPKVGPHSRGTAAASTFTSSVRAGNIHECETSTTTHASKHNLTSVQLFLDLLDPSNCPAIQSSTIMALVTSLLDQPQNTRTFESIDGLLVVTSLFKSRSTSREVKLKLVEFLYFYLMPETNAPKMASSTSATNTTILGGRGKEVIAAFHRKDTFSGPDGGGSAAKTAAAGAGTRTTGEKQNLLGKHLSNVQDLVEDLKEGGGVFGVSAV